MPEWKEVFGKRSWKGIAITAITALLTLAAGALLITAGLIPPSAAWMAVCAAWCIAGLVGGRYALAGGERWLVRGVVSLLATMVLFWVIGLTSPEPMERDVARCLRYIAFGIAGLLAAAAVPGKRRRKAGKKGKSHR